MKTHLVALGSLLSLVVVASLHAAPVSSPLQPTLDAYMQIQAALAGDSLKGATSAATGLVAAINGSGGAVPASVAAQAETLAKSTDIKAAREAFKPLSSSLIAVLSAEKVKSGRYFEAFCPMANASWIQSEKKISNPYFGAEMSGCGEIKKPL